jgi:phenylpropionate dioxygenase-like ring-hydroxylating dioxygenase large terminal subunit
VREFDLGFAAGAGKEGTLPRTDKQAKTMSDPLLVDDWHPVAAASELAPGVLQPALLLGTELALWRAADGRPRAWQDRCPHRGTRLSIGRIERGHLVCAYHGWRFADDGQCTEVPALPGFVPPRGACAKTFSVLESHGLVWVSLGAPSEGPPAFAEAFDPRLRAVVCGPYEVAASGPRVVENFLDLAHFAHVHEGILGERAHPEVRDYEVKALAGGGIIATGCFAWQPRSNIAAEAGTEVEYSYRVTRPLTAILIKRPQAQEGFREAIALHVQPLEEERSRAWVVMAMTEREASDDSLRAFQDAIFTQDRPILENQVPRRLPLAAGAELPVACDRMSQAYRRYLCDHGLRYGVIA